MQLRLSFGAMQSEEPPCVSTCLYIGVEADHKAPCTCPVCLRAMAQPGAFGSTAPLLWTRWRLTCRYGTQLLLLQPISPHTPISAGHLPISRCPSDAGQTVTCCPQNSVAPHLHLSWLPNIRKVVITSGPSRLVVLSAVAPRVVLWAAALAASSSPCWPTVWAAAVVARCHAACTAVGVDGSQHLGGTPAHLKSVHTAGA